MSEGAKQILIRIGEAVGAWLLFGLAVWVVYRAIDIAQTRLEAYHEKVIQRRRLKGLATVLWNQGLFVALTLTKCAAAILLLVQFTVVVSITLNLFPPTRDVGALITGYLQTALWSVVQSVAGYLPSLAFLIVIGIVTTYLLQVVRVFFRAVERGDIELRGFYPEWAPSTFVLVRILVIAFAVVVAFPHLPGGNSDALKGVSIFFGVLLTLGSGSTVGNLIAGIMLTYMRPFRIGDWVEVSGATGEVEARELLVTRIRSFWNEEVIVPNSAILGATITNYSTLAGHAGVYLRSVVTIGYDAPWRTVHELLLSAARDTPGVLGAPEPFVSQTALNDYNVSYQINVAVDKPAEAPRILSALHTNIQERFNAAGVEIMSPAFTALRDGNTITIPKAHRTAEQAGPGAFQVRVHGESKAASQ